MRERKRKYFNQNYKGSLLFGRASITIVGVCLVFTLGLLYLSQSNAIALKGDALSDLEQRRSQLSVEKERLEIEATRLQSIQEIQKEASESGKKFVPVQKINYLPTSNVAVK